MTGEKCWKCGGCGQVADTDEQEPCKRQASEEYRWNNGRSYTSLPMPLLDVRGLTKAYGGSIERRRAGEWEAVPEDDER